MSTSDSGPEPQPRDFLGHLQAAAKELLAAGRAALDVADEVVSDGIRWLGQAAQAGQRDSGADEPKVEKIEVEVEEPES